MKHEHLFANCAAITSLGGLFDSVAKTANIPRIPFLIGALSLVCSSAVMAQTTVTHVEDHKSATIKGKPARISSRTAAWRWTHDGTTLTTAPAKCYGETWTPWHIVESPTFEDAVKEIEKRGLKVSAKLKAEIESTREMLAEEAKRAEAEK